MNMFNAEFKHWPHNQCFEAEIDFWNSGGSLGRAMGALA
jgi:hypothetical protein